MGPRPTPALGGHVLLTGTEWHWARPPLHQQCSTWLLLSRGRSQDSCWRYVICIFSSLQVTVTTDRPASLGPDSPHTDASPLPSCSLSGKSILYSFLALSRRQQIPHFCHQRRLSLKKKTKHFQIQLIRGMC